MLYNCRRLWFCLAPFKLAPFKLPIRPCPVLFRSSFPSLQCDPKKWTLINRSAVCCCCDQRCAFPPTEKWQPFYIACCNRVCVGQKPVFDSPAIRLIKAEGISINEED